MSLDMAALYKLISDSASETQNVFRKEMGGMQTAIVANTKAIESIDQRQVSMEARMTKMEAGQQAASAYGQSTNASITSAAGGFKPGYIECRGWCTWRECEENGLTREEVDVLVTELMNYLPERLRDKVKKPAPDYGKVDRIHFYVAPTDEHAEVMSIWQKISRRGKVVNEKRIWFNAESAPERRHIDSTYGRLCHFVSDKLTNRGLRVEVVKRWHPEYTIHVNANDPTNNNNKLFKAASLNGSVIEWDPEFLSVIQQDGNHTELEFRIKKR
jgi:hypothetical protein